MLEPTWILVLSAFVAVGLLVMRRPGAPPETAIWLWAWALLLASGIIRTQTHDPLLTPLFAYPLDMWFAGLLLAGAFAYCKRTLPAGLVPAVAAAGVLKGAGGAAGAMGLVHGVALVVEPAMVLTAAALVVRTTRHGSASTAQRVLAPNLVVVAVLDAVTERAGLSAGALPYPLVMTWIGVGAVTLGVQIVSVGDQVLQALHRVVEDLEARVRKRTEHLELEISERRAAEQALRRSEERARLVSQLSSDFSFCLRVKPDGSFEQEWVSESATRITGFGSDELANGAWLSILGGDDPENGRTLLQLAAAGRLSDLEQRSFTPSGEPFWLHFNLSTAACAPGSLARVMGAAREITDQKRSEEQRQRLEEHVREVQQLESLGVLAGGIAHDFNNLLMVILGNSRLILSDLSPPEPIREKIDRICGAAVDAGALVEQMLAYSGRHSAAIEVIDLSALVEANRDLLRASVATRSRLEFDLVQDLPPLEGDPAQLRQILLNLVTNAGEAVGVEAGRVTLRTGAMKAEADYLTDTFGSPEPAPGNYVYLEVRDTGPGLDDATRARLFEPFFTTKFSGRGLGLAAVLGIVRTHRGAIKVKSRPGAGCAFRVLFPVSYAITGIAQDPTNVEIDTDAGGLVLVVDDDEGVLEISREFLEHFGYEVLTADGGRDGVKIFHARHPELDAVLLDLAMPDLDGEEAFLEMKALREDVPVILMSGFDEEAARERFAGHGIAGFLRKPYEPEELVRIVQAAVHHEDSGF